MPVKNKKIHTFKWIVGGLVLMLVGLAMWLQAPGAAFAESGPDPLIHRGLVTSRPTGNTGTWVVGGRSFVADGTTEFDVTEGALNVGACAKVRYVSSGGMDVAAEIDSEPAQDCNLSGTITATPSPSATLSGTPSGTPSATPSPSRTPSPTNTHLFRGIVISRPTGIVGTWVVGVRSFVANSNTELSEEEGTLAVGGCAKVRFISSNGVDVADEIDSESADDCKIAGTPSPNPTRDSREDSKVFAKVDALPAAPYTGTWSIGGVEYVANGATEFKQEDGAFAVGVCVKAEFLNANGINVLKEVESEQTSKCEDNLSGSQRNNFKAYGVIDVFTTTVPNNWVVSGITYTVNISTDLKQEHGPFAIGTFVEVKYVVSDTVRTATKIESHVAPGRGSDDRVGTLNSRPSDDWGIWVINGVSYQGDPAIVVDLPANLQANVLSVGSANAAPQMVVVNSYVSGSVNFATLIRALGSNIYMPVLTQ